MTSGTGVAGPDSPSGGGATFGSSVVGEEAPFGSGVKHSASVLGVEKPDVGLTLPGPLARGTDSWLFACGSCATHIDEKRARESN